MTKRRPARSVVLLILLWFGINFCGVGPVLAAGVQVAGTVTIEDGELPPGTAVKVIPVDGGNAYAALVGADGSFTIPKLPEGEYLFEVFTPDGTALGKGVTHRVDEKHTQIDLEAVFPVAGAAAGSAAGGTEGMSTMPMTDPPAPPDRTSVSLLIH